MPSNKHQDLRLRVEGMDCPGCALKIETAVGRLPGVSEVRVNVGSGSVVVVSPEQAADAPAVTQAIERLGYKVLPTPANLAKAVATSPDGHSADDGHGHSHSPDELDKAWWQTAKARYVFAAAVLLAVALAVSRLVPSLGVWPFTVATLVALVPVARRAFGAARSGQVFTIEMLMTIAAVGALVIRAAEEAAVVVLLFAIGELLEGVAASRARKSISALAALTPKTARIEEGAGLREVPAESLQPGQIVLARPGDRIPCDGQIVEGSSDIDESTVTGESVPRRKGEGDEVFAGTIVVDGALRIEVTKAAKDNTIARIVRLVEEAQETKAPVQRFVDRFARVYMPVVVLVAFLVAVGPPLLGYGDWDTWIYRALALLLIACPCALVISTPAAVAAGLAAGARRGLLIKGGATLESLGRLQTIAFDKTGTLTNGRPKVTDVVSPGMEPNELLRLAAALESGSSHPVARAILDHAAERGIAVAAGQSVTAVAGRGVKGEVEGRHLFVSSPRFTRESVSLSREIAAAIEQMEFQGKTVAVLSEGDVALGFIAVRDEPREDAQMALQRLKSMGVIGIMLTGDNARTGKAVADGLGIEARAELLPEDKAKIVQELREKGRGPVGKVGDGINDAPALAQADVGIAMGAGTDVALETADAALLGNRVMGVAELIALSRATMQNVRNNVIIALGSKAVFLVTTVLGVTGMWIAVLADTGATVLVTLNALQMLRFKFK